MRIRFASALLAICVATPALAARDTELPFILWTKADIAAMKDRIAKEPWAKKCYEQDLQNPAGVTQINLFKYLAYGDNEAADIEKKKLVGFINHATLDKDAWDWQWHHADTYQHALRYEALYDLLTAAERKSIEDTFRKFARWGIEEEPLRGFSSYGRHPGQHILALALRDQRLIKGIFNAKGGMKDFIDSLQDTHFFRDSINHLTIAWTHIILWCNACERLGLDEIGYGYVGRNGASVKTMIEGLTRTGLPQMNVPQHPPLQPKLSLGRTAQWHNDNTRFPWEIFPAPLIAHPMQQHARAQWVNANSAGLYSADPAVARMNHTLAMEILHRKFPERHLDYFLVNLRAPGDDKYYPSVFSGLDPIDPGSVKAPTAPSGHYPERKLAMLRAEESPAYWTSPAPVVAFNSTGVVPGWLGDTMSIAHFSAYNRPLYVPPVTAAPRWGGNWAPSGRAGNSVMVDNFQMGRRIEQMRWVNFSKYPMPNVPSVSRAAFDPLVKFVSARSSIGEIEVTGQQGKVEKQELAIFPGTTFERSLMLTREYLFDVFTARSSAARDYHWIIHALGQPQHTPDWTDTDDLTTRIGDPSKDAPTFQWTDQKQLKTNGNAWTFTALQTHADPAKSALGPAWYDRKIGVRITMLGDPGTTAYTARPVELARKEGRKSYNEVTGEIEQDTEFTPRNMGAAEVGNTTILAHRKAQTTSFVAVHEPFEKATPQIDTVERFAQADDAVGITVTGKNINDRLFVKIGDRPDAAATLEHNGEAITFSGHACLRLTKDAVHASGDIHSLTLKVAGTTAPRLVLNGKEVSAPISNGLLKYTR